MTLEQIALCGTVDFVLFNNKTNTVYIFLDEEGSLAEWRLPDNSGAAHFIFGGS